MLWRVSGPEGKRTSHHMRLGQLGLSANSQVAAHCPLLNTQQHHVSVHTPGPCLHTPTVGGADGVKTLRQFSLALCFLDSQILESSSAVLFSVCSVLVHAMS